jgi:hypothetical protein
MPAEPVDSDALLGYFLNERIEKDSCHSFLIGHVINDTLSSGMSLVHAGFVFGRMPAYIHCTDTHTKVS